MFAPLCQDEDHDDAEYMEALGKIGVIVGVMYLFWVFETFVCLRGGAGHSHGGFPTSGHQVAPNPNEETEMNNDHVCQTKPDTVTAMRDDISRMSVVLDEKTEKQEPGKFSDILNRDILCLLFDLRFTKIFVPIGKSKR